MPLGERLFVILLLCCVVFCKNGIKAQKRNGRNFLALLGYIHGFKIGQEFALQNPSYLISPVIIVPSTNQQQSVNIQQSATDENYQEIGGPSQILKPAKLVLNSTKTRPNEVEIAYAPKRKATQKEKENEEMKQGLINTLRQNDLLNLSTTTVMVTNNTNAEETTQTTSNSSISIIEATTLTIIKENGSYPSASYDNGGINSISLTTVSDEEQKLPPVIDVRWQNFKANLSNLMFDDNTTINNEANNTVSNESSNLTEVVTEGPKETTTYGNGPYPNRWYWHNNGIDQLSITTNYYTNEYSNDRWGSPANEIKGTKSSGFKPLAGLYYDGFLHRPLKKFGFIPQSFTNQ